MRGLQVRVLTNLENLNAKMKSIEDISLMLELQENVKLILDMVEAYIQKFDQNSRHERESLWQYTRRRRSDFRKRLYKKNN